MRTLNMDEVARSLNIPGFGRNKLFKLLKEKHIVDSHNICYQKFVDLGYFALIRQHYNVGAEKRLSLKTTVTEKGVKYIDDLVKKNNEEITF